MKTHNSAFETQGLGMIPMVIEQSGRGERSYDISKTGQTRHAGGAGGPKYDLVDGLHG